MDEQVREIYALIGFIVVEFSRLDAELSGILITLINPDDRLLGATLTDSVSISAKLNQLRKVARVRSLESEMEELLTHVGRVKAYRNEFVHGDWEIQVDPGGTPEAMCRTHRLAFERHGDRRTWRFSHARRVTIGELEERASEVESVRRKAALWLNLHRDALEALNLR